MKSNSWDVHTYSVDGLKRHQVQARLSQSKQCKIIIVMATVKFYLCNTE